MVVTLKVVSYQKNVLGPDAQMQFDPQGGSFGRSEDNDWVLPDPERIISSRHGLIGFRDGEFWITDCSTNGIYLGDKSVLLGKGKSVMLHHGDRLILGEYEVEVGLEPVRRRSDEMPAGSDTPDPGRDNLINEPQFDPLAALGGGSDNASGSFRVHSLRTTDDPSGAMPNHSSPMHDAFEVPAPRRSRGGPDSPSTGNPIPEDWDMTGFRTPAANKQTNSHSDADVEDPFCNGVISPATDAPEPDSNKARASSVAGTPPPAPSGEAQHGNPDYSVNENPIPKRPRAPADTGPEKSSGNADAGPVPLPSVGDGGDLVRTFLKAAGLDVALFEAIDSSDAMSECGHLFGALLQGMMELLRARSEMKNEFRMSLTMVRASENNPLKFTINASEVLRILLVDKPSGYLSADASVAEGVDDLRNHQLAMIAGMQAAFTSLVQRLNPDCFRNANEQKSWLQSLLPLAEKAGAWDNYRRFYTDTASSDQAFQKLFGDIFVQAYEEQNHRLRFEAGK